jgi:hypothetical protein
MAKMTPITMVFNAAGAVAALVVGGYAINSFFAKDETPPCMASYPPPLLLNLRDGAGELLTPQELQGSFGREEWGVMDNVKVVGSKKGAEMLEVKLASGEKGGASLKGGAGFKWSPGSVENATRACLSYRVNVPKAFSFEAAGQLPGLFGGSEGANFVSHFVWGNGGSAAISASSEAGARERNSASLKLEPGKSYTIMSEVVLNRPGASNGVLRLWVDGELKVERENVDWRADEAVRIAGVAADMTYSADTIPTLEKDAKIQLSPFELSWQ